MSCCPEDGLMSVDAAIERLVSAAKIVVSTEQVTLAEACGRTLAQSVEAQVTVPPNDNSAMDGYAFRQRDIEASLSLPIGLRVVAGDAPGVLPVRTAARIFTGAPVPEGADTVAMQEACHADDEQVTLPMGLKTGMNIRRKGEDISLGMPLFDKGARLRAQDIGLLASVGVRDVLVFKPLRVGLISSGDELLEPGEKTQPGKIYNSNRYMLSALLKQWGFEVVDYGVIKDSLDATQAALQCAAHEVDVILTTGGVSVGEEDYIKAAVDLLGRLDLWRVAIKPGKPFAFGRVGDAAFIGLPGNPVSVFVTCLVLALPFLAALQGRHSRTNTSIKLPAWFVLDKPGKRDEFIRVRKESVGGVLGVASFRNQSSGALSSVVWSDGVVKVPAGQVVEHGQLVDYQAYETFGW